MIGLQQLIPVSFPLNLKNGAVVSHHPVSNREPLHATRLIRQISTKFNYKSDFPSLFYLWYWPNQQVKTSRKQTSLNLNN